MVGYREYYWQQRLEQCQKALEARNFQVFPAQNAAAARQIVLEEILPNITITTVAWGDSLSLQATGILDALAADSKLRIINTFEKGVSREEILQRRRRALSADLFLSGTNALTEDGKLINLDMVGNRVAALPFGPRHVVLIVGPIN